MRSPDDQKPKGQTLAIGCKCCGEVRGTQGVRLPLGSTNFPTERSSLQPAALAMTEYHRERAQQVRQNSFAVWRHPTDPEQLALSKRVRDRGSAP